MADEKAIRITDQHRGKAGMVYDLKCGAERLTLCVSPYPADGGDAWKIEARTSHAGEALVVDGTGRTRRDALDEVARAWSDHALARRIPAFDWDAVAGALAAVRAI
jgi:hypothetical protein